MKIFHYSLAKRFHSSFVRLSLLTLWLRGKNNTLELLKLFASYMVVFIHVPFYGKIGAIINALARFAVPFFFLVSGFYSYHITPQKIITRTKKMLSLFLFSAAFYTVLNILLPLLSGKPVDIVAYFSQYIRISTIVRVLFVNASFSAVHLWYLSAMIYVYIIFYFVTIHRLKEKVIFTISLSLLVAQLLLGEVLSAFGIVLPHSILRNFALMGIPFFSLGLLAKKYKDKLHSVPNYVVIIALVVGTLETIFSRYFFEMNEVYLGSLFVLFQHFWLI